MHTFEYKHKRDDGKTDIIIFHHNGDMSGIVTIHVNDQSSDYMIPFEAMEALVAKKVRMKMLSLVEGMDTEELLALQGEEQAAEEMRSKWTPNPDLILKCPECGGKTDRYLAEWKAGDLDTTGPVFTKGLPCPQCSQDLKPTE